MPNLFSALQTPKLTLKNRIVMPPMANNLCGEDGAVNDALIAHYVRRAEAEVALLIVEHSYVLPSGRAGRKQLGIHDDALVAGLGRLVDEVHRRGGQDRHPDHPCRQQYQQRGARPSAAGSLTGAAPAQEERDTAGTYTG